MKSYKKLGLSLTVLALSMGSFSCNNEDFLDRRPKSSVSPQDFLLTEQHLADYAINYYTSVFSTPSGYNIGASGWDNDTDNQAQTDANETIYTLGNRKTPNSGSLGLQLIRACNYFIQDVEAKVAENKISGDASNIKQYLGEMYVIRAMAYFAKLQTYGDFPIVLETLPTTEEVLVAHAKRSPSNIVARQILSDFDKGISMLKNNFARKNRINKDAALVLKSRVALYEATFLKYHRGTPRVPGEAGWPGAKMEYNKDFHINLDDEINFFLDQAMAASKEVADKISLTENNHTLEPTKATMGNWNPYYDMFSARDVSTFPEVLLWREYSLELGVNSSSGTNSRAGGNTGFTRAFVESFLMKNGLPIYAPNSGYMGDDLITKVKENRDERLSLFLFDENSPVRLGSAQPLYYGAPGVISVTKETKDITGYRPRKFFSYDEAVSGYEGLNSQSGFPIIRAAEAYLVYLEASYLRKGNIDSDADRYWKALRHRAGVDENYQNTIAATDMNREKADWGAYSGGQLVDPTLYNIRRERRNEFIAEGRRWSDLIRWRSFDQVKDYVVEGANFWTEMYKNSAYYTKATPTATDSTFAIFTRDNAGKEPNLSPKSESKYIRPYRVVQKNNKVFDGYTVSKSIYLSPIAYRELQLASPTGDANASNLYQTPYWPVEPNKDPLED